jgi:putative addiction module antidote
MLKLKVTTVGSSVGVILTKEAQSMLRIKKGDTVFLTETPTGALLTAYDPDFARQMQLAEDLMHEDKDILRALAK